jgi:hypothetical protein
MIDKIPIMRTCVCRMKIGGTASGRSVRCVYTLRPRFFAARSGSDEEIEGRPGSCDEMTKFLRNVSRETMTVAALRRSVPHGPRVIYAAASRAATNAG